MHNARDIRHFTSTLLLWGLIRSSFTTPRE